MGMRINTNVTSLSAIRALSTTSKALGRALERLATGSRINHAGDDAAGLAISTGLESQRRGLNLATRNVNDANAYLQVAEGGLQSLTDILQRMKELSIQASNGTLGATDRSYLNSEFQKLYAEFQRQIDQTNFNGTNVFAISDNSLSVQVGTSLGQKIDLVSTTLRTDDIFRALTPLGTFSSAATLTASSQTGGDFGDINGDDIPDYLNYGSGGWEAYGLGNGDGTFQAMRTFAFGNYPIGHTFDDINGDGFLDVLGIASATGAIQYALGNGNGTFRSMVSLSAGSAWTIQGSESIFVKDLNNDGKNDLLKDNDDGTTTVYYATAAGVFSSATTYNWGSFKTFHIDDFNNDGRQDLVLRWEGGSQTKVALNQGDGTFSVSSTIAYGGFSEIKSGDINEDGKNDLIFANGANNPGIAFGLGDGTFTAIRTFGKTSGSTDPRGVTVADFNQDGHLDMATANWTTTDVSLYYGDGTGNMSLQVGNTYIGGTSSPYTRTRWLDLNGDGFLDFAAVNTVNTMVVRLQNSTTQALGSRLNISTQFNAQNSIDYLDTAMDSLMSLRSQIGAQQNRLQSSANVSQTTAENIAQAKSQIIDADVATETAELTRSQILQQAGVSVLGQANTSMQVALQLLKGIG